MTQLEMKKLQMELLNIQAAMAAKDYRICQLLDEIERLKRDQEISLKTEESIKQKIAQGGDINE